MKKTTANLKRLALCLCAVFIFAAGAFAITAHADDDPKPRKAVITPDKKTVTAGKTFKLRAKLTPRDADEDDLVWSIVKGKKILRFDEDDRDDEEVELKALKSGTATVCCRIRGTKKRSYAVIKVKPAPKSRGTIRRSGSAVRTVETGDDFELKVRKSSGVRDRNLRWSIADKNIVRFDDDDRYDNEVEFKALRIGKTQITCRNIKTNSTVTFTVKVVRENDDWDDDRYDDDWDDGRDDRNDEGDDWDDDDDDDD